MSDIVFIDRISGDGTGAQLEAHMPSGQWVVITYTNHDQYKQALEMMTKLFFKAAFTFDRMQAAKKEEFPNDQHRPEQDDPCDCGEKQSRRRVRSI